MNREKRERINTAFFATIKAVVFLLIFFYLLETVQLVLIRKNDYPSGASNGYASVNGVKDLPNDSVDVFFFGTSHMARGCSPMYMYDEFGITSYNMSYNGENLDSIHLLLRSLFREQSPKLIVIDASCIFFCHSHRDDYEVVLRNAANSLDISSRLSLIDDDILYYNDDNYSKDIYDDDGGIDYGVIDKNLVVKASYVFPIIKYHSRWNDLKENDLRDTNNDHVFADYTLGHVVSARVTSANTDIDYMNQIADMLEKEGHYDITIPSHNKRILGQIRDLCEENGCELLITKIPSVYHPVYYNSAWTRSKYLFLSDYLKTEGIEYYDLLYDTDLGIDCDKDFADGGMHLNIRGGMKTSCAVGEYIISNFDLMSHDNDIYDEYLKKYKELTRVAWICSEEDMEEYLKLLSDNEDYLITICVNDNAYGNMTLGEFRALRELGLKSSFSESMFNRTSYIAVIDSGHVVYEDISDAVIKYDYEIKNEVKLHAESKNYYCGCSAIININGSNYSVNKRGFNIAVFDRESGLVIDKVSFDTFSENHTAIRPGNDVADMIGRYETYLSYGKERDMLYD